ncbi:prepilin-type N-terminal cleavage/methylation domain-containing protein [Lachnospiraceae bacterium C10]|nr:prepilin-type N-terminal cleavage/methylation domain-containing protein [Lachnospiraceae bacterium C10]SDW36579.1 prepilin-type N-terminal cleavage/methylation domain-containing protein [Lachnospiraceae bacterium KHCPX20]
MKARYIRKLHKVKGNQQGFTLVEVLIAAIILAVIIVPLLNQFVFSSKVTQKARMTGNQTLAAENLYEKVKGADVSVLIPKVDGSGHANPRDLSNLKNYFDADSVTLSQAKTTSPGQSVLDVKNAYVTNGRYDARITLDDQGETAQYLNNQLMTKKMSFDHVCLIADTDDQEYTRNLTDECTVIKRERSIKVTFEKTEEDGIIYVKPVILRTYNIVFDRPTTESERSVYGSHKTERFEDETVTEDLEPFAYTIKDEDGEIREVPFDFFLIYSPYYESTSINNKDDITIDNSANFKGDCFVVRENRSAEGVTYSGTINLLEQHEEDRIEDFAMKMHSNMSLKNGITDAVKELDFGTYRLRYVHNAEGWYREGYHTISSSGNTVVSDPYSILTVLKQEKVEHVFRVTIQIYEHTDGDEEHTESPLYTLQGMKVW